MMIGVGFGVPLAQSLTWINKSYVPDLGAAGILLIRISSGRESGSCSRGGVPPLTPAKLIRTEALKLVEQNRAPVSVSSNV